MQPPRELTALPADADAAESLAVITNNYAAAGENAAALAGWQRWWLAVLLAEGRDEVRRWWAAQ